MSGQTSYPALLNLPGEDDYRQRFFGTYCQTPVTAFDGIALRFRKRNFEHAFFESTGGQKDNSFSWKRASRMDWIRAALQDPTSERYEGWDKGRKAYTRDRRVAIVQGDYVVVIAIKRTGHADFVTAFVADTPSRPGRSSTIQQIRQSPKWT